MRIATRLDDLANELKDYSGIAYTLATAMDLDCDASNLYSSAAHIIFCGLDDIINKIRILADHIGESQPTPFRTWIKTYLHGAGQWHFATNEQVITS